MPAKAKKTTKSKIVKKTSVATKKTEVKKTVAKKPAAKKTVTKKTLIATFSKAIRERDDYTCTFPNCPHCGNYSKRDEGGVDCAHYYRCYRASGRWHPPNCTTLCRKQHNYLDEHDPHLVAFFTKLLGKDAHDELIKRHHGVFRYKPWERWEMNQHYQAQIKKMEKQRMDGVQGRLVLSGWD